MSYGRQKFSKPRLAVFFLLYMVTAFGLTSCSTYSNIAGGDGLVLREYSEFERFLAYSVPLTLYARTYTLESESAALAVFRAYVVSGSLLATSDVPGLFAYMRPGHQVLISIREDNNDEPAGGPIHFTAAVLQDGSSSISSKTIDFFRSSSFRVQGYPGRLDLHGDERPFFVILSTQGGTVDPDQLPFMSLEEIAGGIIEGVIVTAEIKPVQDFTD